MFLTWVSKNTVAFDILQPYSQDQYFAAISNTNTSVLDTGSAGIFGLGFPVNRWVLSKCLSRDHSNVCKVYSGMSFIPSLRQTHLRL